MKKREGGRVERDTYARTIIYTHTHARVHKTHTCGSPRAGTHTYTHTHARTRKRTYTHTLKAVTPHKRTWYMRTNKNTRLREDHTHTNARAHTYPERSERTIKQIPTEIQAPTSESPSPTHPLPTHMRTHTHTPMHPAIHTHPYAG